MFITFEGPEGSGKSTQVTMLTEVLRQMGANVLATREPGGTAIGNGIRSILLNPAHTEMDGRTEALLYFAARAQLVSRVIRPALDVGTIVVCDRYVDSSYAYQGFGRNQPIQPLQLIAWYATDGLVPDLTFYLDLDPVVGLRRKQKEEWTRFEAEEIAFHRRVVDGYRRMIDKAENARWVVVDASKPILDVHLAVFEETVKRIGTVAREE